MIEVDRFWDWHTHTFHIPLCFQTKVYNYAFYHFHYRVSEKQVLEKSSFGKTSFGKTGFCFRKECCQNMILIYLVLIHDHTLVLKIPRTLSCIYISKEFSLKKDWFQKYTQIKILAHFWSTGRSTVGRAKLLCRLTDMHQSASVHFGRPCDRSSAALY